MSSPTYVHIDLMSPSLPSNQHLRRYTEFHDYNLHVFHAVIGFKEYYC